MTDRNNSSEFINKHLSSKIKLSKAQQEIVDDIYSGKTIRMVRRPARLQGLTADQIAVFNRVCEDGKKRIQWHAPNWVAMDRKSYDKLVAAANGSNIKIIVDEVD